MPSPRVTPGEVEAAFQEFWDASLFGDQEQPARGMAEAVFRRGYEAALSVDGWETEYRGRPNYKYPWAAVDRSELDSLSGWEIESQVNGPWVSVKKEDAALTVPIRPDATQADIARYTYRVDKAVEDTAALRVELEGIVDLRATSDGELRYIARRAARYALGMNNKQ